MRKIKGITVLAVTVILFCSVPYSASGANKTTKMVEPSGLKIISLTSGTSQREGEITVKWSSAKCSGYQLEYSRDRSFKTAGTWSVSDSANVTRKIFNLKKGEQYWVRVRAFNSYGSLKKYGRWSDLKSICAHLHRFSSHVKKEPSCGIYGAEEYKCGCGYSFEISLSPLHHAYMSKVTKRADCTSEGERKYTCKRCGDSYIETIPKSLEHEEEKRGNAVVCRICGKMIKTLPQEKVTGKKSKPRNVTEGSDKGYTHTKNKRGDLAAAKSSDEATKKSSDKTSGVTAHSSSKKSKVASTKKTDSSERGSKIKDTSKHTVKHTGAERTKVRDNTSAEKITTKANRIKAPATKSKKLTYEERNHRAVMAAVDWAVNIANDDSFHYGKSKWAHHHGCYFCGTNQRKGSPKRRAGASVSDCAKTYCCNPFVTAAFHHGAGAKEIDCKVAGKRINLANDRNKALKNRKYFKRISKPNNVTKLKAGDILLTPTHAMLYAGGGNVVHAAHHDNGKRDKMWKSSITCGKISNKQWRRVSKIYRYKGTGKF